MSAPRKTNRELIDELRLVLTAGFMLSGFEQPGEREHALERTKDWRGRMWKLVNELEPRCVEPFSLTREQYEAIKQEWRNE